MVVSETLTIGRSNESSVTIANVSAVALNGQAVLFHGASGSGKSTYSLQLMALGADLVCDDGAILTRFGDEVVITCPPAIKNKIEARDIGILNAQSTPRASLAFVVDLDQIEVKRLPSHQVCRVLGLQIPLIRKADGPHFVPALVQLLKGGFAE